MNTSSLTNFYIVRHGETEWNVKKILQGHKDSPLTEQGISEAKKLAQLFQHIEFSDIFSSDLLRAKRTAELIAHQFSLSVKTSQLLRELRLGKFEGRSVQEFRQKLKKRLELQEQLTDVERMRFRLAKDIETHDEMIERFTVFFRQTAPQYVGKNVLVVSHGGMMRTLLIHLGFGNFQEMQHGAVKNLGYIQLASDGDTFIIKETSNIEKQPSELH